MLNECACVRLGSLHWALDYAFDMESHVGEVVDIALDDNHYKMSKFSTLHIFTVVFQHHTADLELPRICSAQELLSIASDHWKVPEPMLCQNAYVLLGRRRWCFDSAFDMADCTDTTIYIRCRARGGNLQPELSKPKSPQGGEADTLAYALDEPPNPKS